jgi:hypothetical protein
MTRGDGLLTVRLAEDDPRPPDVPEPAPSPDPVPAPKPPPGEPDPGPRGRRASPGRATT